MKSENVIRQFLASVDALIQYFSLTDTRIVYEDFPQLTQVLYNLEKILQFGLKNGNHLFYQDQHTTGFFTTYTLWDLLTCLSSCVPNVADVLKEAR
jgi:hypothetical protein